MRKDSTQRVQEAEASPFIESSPIESEVETKGKRRGQARLWLRLRPAVMVRGAIGDTAENGHKPMTRWQVYCGAHPDLYNMTGGRRAKGRVC